MPSIQSRRSFVTNAAVAGAAGLGALGATRSGDGKSFAAEPPLETTSIRIVNWRGLICPAPQWVAEPLLGAEGFTEIHYIEQDSGEGFAAKIARGEADFTVINPVELIPAMDAGVPIIVVSGVHAGCVELFANQDVRGIADLRHRVVGLRWGEVDRQFVSIMASYVGLDPMKDINWVAITDPSVPPGQLLTEGKIDAFIAVPPEPQELRARNVGHVIVNWSVDRPWSQVPSVACWPAIRSSSAKIRWPPNGPCAPFSKRPIYAPPNQAKWRSCWSIAATPKALSTRCNR